MLRLCHNLFAQNATVRGVGCFVIFLLLRSHLLALISAQFSPHYLFPQVDTATFRNIVSNMT